MVRESIKTVAALVASGLPAWESEILQVKVTGIEPGLRGARRAVLCRVLNVFVLWRGGDSS